MEFVDKESAPPDMSRSSSESLAVCFQVDKARARQALNLAKGDVNLAAAMLMNGVVGGAGEVSPDPVKELMDLGGLSQTHAEEFLTAAGGDLEIAKENLLTFMGISTSPEQYSSLKHPASLITCPVCFDKPESTAELVQLQQCSHVFCEGCLQCWIKSEAGSNSSGSIRCPHNGCKNVISHQELKELLQHEEKLFRQIDRRALEVLSASDSSMHLCPSPDCTYIVSWDPEDAIGGISASFTCPLCEVQRCLACGSSPYHANMTCVEHIQHLRDQKKRGESAEGNKDLIAQEQATVAYLETSGFRICKKCKNGVMKSSGCDKMKCRCGYRFCYQCNAENARCGCTPRNHGFWDNITSRGDFSNLR